MDLIKKQRKQIEKLLEDRKYSVDQKKEVERLTKELERLNLSYEVSVQKRQEETARANLAEVDKVDRSELLKTIESLRSSLRDRDTLITAQNRERKKLEDDVATLKSKIDESGLKKAQRRLEEKSKEIEDWRKLARELEQREEALKRKLDYYVNNERLSAPEKTA